MSDKSVKVVLLLEVDNVSNQWSLQISNLVVGYILS
jgi:hypothetical protein